MAWKNDQISEKETDTIIELAKEALATEGDYVELGCYKGDTSLLLAELIYEYNRENSVDNSVDNFVKKKLWIYDSFEGLPEKTKDDSSVMGENFKRGELMVTKREVKNRFLKTGLPVPVIKKSWFNELTGDDLPEKIAFAFLDGDFYESIRDSLNLVTSRIASKGVMIVHDYTNPALPGVKKAVDEWIQKGTPQFKVILL